MSTARFLVGDTRKVMTQLPDQSVDLVLTSPPFLALRSYLPADHPDKAAEIGSEPTPAEFVDVLLDCTEEWARLLTPHGSIGIELGDTFSGSGGAGGDYADGGMREAQPKFRQGTPRWDGRPEGQIRTTTSDPVSYPARGSGGWPLPKSLALIPESYRWALAYGRNPFNGRETPRWRVRNVVRWVRPNPPVGQLADKFRPATSELVIACKARDRWFDLDAVRTEHKSDPEKPGGVYKGSLNGTDYARWQAGEKSNQSPMNPAGAPPLDWWHIAPTGYAGSHYAVFPPELCRIPIEAMCPRRVCRACGEPSRREVGEATYPGSVKDGARADGVFMRGGGSVAGTTTGSNAGLTRSAPTTGWSSCGCPGTDGIRLDGFHTGTGWRPGVVLDPFAGTGTTLMVATGRGRDAIGIDLDERNLDLARKRLGMFLEESDLGGVA